MTSEKEHAELARRIEELRAFEREYRSRLRDNLKGLLREIDPGSDEVAVSRSDLRMFLAALGGSQTLEPGTLAAAAEQRLRDAARGAS